MSLIRYFVTEVLDVISPPFTEEFVQLFYPLVSNELVTGSMRTESEQQLVDGFISKFSKLIINFDYILTKQLVPILRSLQTKL